jgi:DsbC/DsbD-like thiol-disulfide interchange protein
VSGFSGRCIRFAGSSAALVAALGVAAGHAPAQTLPQVPSTLRPQQPKVELVTPRLVAEHDALAPGETHRIGVTLAMAPKWHIYWRNPGDTGTPPVITFTAPEGVEVGDIVWPAPMRYIHAAGMLIDYTYEGAVTLVAPVRVTPAYSGEGPITIKAEVEWLVCKEACIPGSASLSIRLPLADAQPQPSSDAALFAATDARTPRPLTADDPVQVGWSGDTLRLSALGATKMAFYPLAPELPIPVNAVRDAGADADTLTIEYPASIRAAALVEGVLEVVSGPGAGLYTISIPSPEGE